MGYRFMRFHDGREKAMTFSYDDGVKADLRFIEILNKYNLKGTFNINAASILNAKDDSRLTKQELIEKVIKNGHEVAVHGQHHIAPGSVPAKDGIADVYFGRRDLENCLGQIIRGMAYPDSGIRSMNNGASYEEIKSYLKMLGIVYSRTLCGDNNGFEMPNDWYAWMPTAHHNNPKLFEYLDEFVNFKMPIYQSDWAPKLFYLWGHTYEFDNDKNWDMIEEFCKKASGRDDIWYATNIEIYEYTNAYNSLIFNTDNTLVYNPTLIDVWFVFNGKNYEVKSGETILLN